jgi:hypothetical protein
MEYDVKKEKELSNIGFKKRWLSDKSGYWFEKNVNYKDFKLQFICETDRNLFLMSVKTFEYYGDKMNSSDYENIKKFKCDLKTIKQTLKKYK